MDKIIERLELRKNLQLQALNGVRLHLARGQHKMRVGCASAHSRIVASEGGEEAWEALRRRAVMKIVQLTKRGRAQSYPRDIEILVIPPHI
jgi:hypothetical protein